MAQTSAEWFLPCDLERPDCPIDFNAPDNWFEPCGDTAQWLRSTFVEDGAPLQNEAHWHLKAANIGVLWTNTEQNRQMRRIAATAEAPQPQGSKWVSERQKFQLRRWFGQVPDFVITFDRNCTEAMSLTQWCAICEHELYHCSYARDPFGAPKFRKDGNPRFALLGHDVEEFNGIVARYPLSALHPNIAKMVAAANAGPQIEIVRVQCSCGSCGGDL